MVFLLQQLKWTKEVKGKPRTGLLEIRGTDTLGVNYAGFIDLIKYKQSCPLSKCKYKTSGLISNHVLLV